MLRRFLAGVVVCASLMFGGAANAELIHYEIAGVDDPDAVMPSHWASFTLNMTAGGDFSALVDIQPQCLADFLGASAIDAACLSALISSGVVSPDGIDPSAAFVVNFPGENFVLHSLDLTVTLRSGETWSRGIGEDGGTDQYVVDVEESDGGNLLSIDMLDARLEQVAAGPDHLYQFFANDPPGCGGVNGCLFGAAWAYQLEPGSSASPVPEPRGLLIVSLLTVMVVYTVFRRRAAASAVAASASQLPNA